MLQGWGLDLDSKERGGEMGGVGGLGVPVLGLARLFGFGFLVAGGGELAGVEVRFVLEGVEGMDGWV